MTRSRHQFAWLSGIFFIGLLLFYTIFFFSEKKNPHEVYIKDLLEKLDVRSQELNELAEGIVKSFGKGSFQSEQFNFWSDDFFQHSLGKNYLLLVYADDSLLFWNNSLVSFFPIDSLAADTGVISNHQGLFLFARANYQNYHIVVIDPVYLFYPIRNQYIESGFTDHYRKFSGKLKIISKLVDEINPKTLRFHGRDIFIADDMSFSGKEAETKTSEVDFIISLLILLLFSTLEFGIGHSVNTERKAKSQLLFLFFIPAFYTASIVYSIWKLPDGLRNLAGETFSVLPIINDFMFSFAITCLVVIFLIIDFIQSRRFNEYAVLFRGLVLGLLLLILPLAMEQVFDYFLQQSALTDLLLSANFLNFRVLLKLSGVFLFASSTIYLIGILLDSISELPLKKSVAFSVAIAPWLLSLVLWLFFQKLVFIYFFLSPVIFFTIHKRQRIKLSRSNNSGITMAWIVVSLSLALLYSHSDLRLADEEQMLTARKLSSDKDPLLEFLFNDLSTNWVNDSVLKKILFDHQAADQKINEYLRQTYLTGYLSRYETEVTTCYPEQDLIVQPENRKVNCIDYFNSLTSIRGDSLKPGGLFMVDNNLLGVHYVGYITIGDSSFGNADSLHLFVEFFHKYIPEGTGYPDLLIDADNSLGPDLNKYSFATYREGTLYYKFGTYFFPLRLDQISTGAEGFFNRDGYRHLALKYSDKTLIISRKEKEWAELMAPFSFFFLINGLIVIILSLIRRGLPDFRKVFSTFRTRLQLIISVSLLASFVLIGTITTVYLTDIYRKKNDDFLAEKTQSLIVELEHKLQGLPIEGNRLGEYLNQILLKFSLVFFTDINLYDFDGRLLATSRPEIFDLGLTGSMMHPQAYKAMRFQNRLYLRQYEEIGKARFISSYAPFKNANGEIIAFINLPYFVKETEMQREVRSVVLSYLNIFLLLSAISLLFALFISQRLTRPLQMIQQKMSRLQLGHANEKINYQGYDEIGELVNQYNTLLDQLAKSAELLARSERESAWREMARQVAHEIKNPLTPMRLSVQYLLRAWDDQDPDMDQKLRNISQTLISQIDTLSSIASAFSDFAVMPQPRPVRIDLTEALQKVISLFDHHSNISLIFNNKTRLPAWINADPEHINRIFTNLVKNSIQAIGSKPEAKIVVKLSELDNAYQVEVEDTGKGMTEEEARKVFTPNFTTKSSGMGMGLSIVYNLVQQSGGNISFETRPGVGTTFTVELPKAAEKA